MIAEILCSRTSQIIQSSTRLFERLSKKLADCHQLEYNISSIMDVSVLEDNVDPPAEGMSLEIRFLHLS